VAVGYQDVVSIANTTLNQTAGDRSHPLIMMVPHISLGISLFMTGYNARIALVER